MKNKSEEFKKLVIENESSYKLSTPISELQATAYRDGLRDAFTEILKRFEEEADQSSTGRQYDGIMRAIGIIKEYGS